MSWKPVRRAAGRESMRQLEPLDQASTHDFMRRWRDVDQELARTRP